MESSDEIVINQIIGERQILYTIGNADPTASYMLDLNSNTAIVLGTDIWTPRISPDGKYFAYENRSSSYQRGFYIHDIENDEKLFLAVDENDYMRIIGWVDKTSSGSQPADMLFQ